MTLFNKQYDLANQCNVFVSYIVSKTVYRSHSRELVENRDFYASSLFDYPVSSHYICVDKTRMRGEN